MKGALVEFALFIGMFAWFWFSGCCAGWEVRKHERRVEFRTCTPVRPFVGKSPSGKPCAGVVIRFPVEEEEE